MLGWNLSINLYVCVCVCVSVYSAFWFHLDIDSIGYLVH